MKPATQLVYAYLAANRDRAVPANELLRSLMMVDYRSRISEIRKHLRDTGAPIRVESRRIKGQRTNEYRLITEAL
jgi:hypothetical protein